MGGVVVSFNEDWQKIDEAFGDVLETYEGDDLFEVLSAGAWTLLGKAQTLAPVDTGFLRASGQLEREGDIPIVGFSAEYAVHQEYGTRFIPAHPYMRPAMEDTDAILAAMQKVHQRKLGKAAE